MVYLADTSGFYFDTLLLFFILMSISVRLPCEVISRPFHDVPINAEIRFHATRS